MAGKFGFLVGLGVGYVLGARSGRERYEQIADKAQQVWRGSGAPDRMAEAGVKVAEQVGLREPGEPVAGDTGAAGGGRRAGAPGSVPGSAGPTGAVDPLAQDPGRDEGHR